MPTYLPADEMSKELAIATNLVAGLYIACTEPSWLTSVAILAAANIVPVIEAVATGIANRRITGHASWSDSTKMQWSHRDNSSALFYYPTISPSCISRETAETIINTTEFLHK